MSYFEYAYKRYNEVRARAARAADEFPSFNNLRLQKPSFSCYAHKMFYFSSIGE